MFLKHSRQRRCVITLIFVRYLEEDPSTVVLERRRELKGYELYVVEQWACSRVHPTFVITTFTGLPQHSVFVGVLSVPTDEEIWSPRLRVYLRAISKFHARKKETPLGTLMVTNLSGFPSALTVISVPGGDVKSHREAFIVNEDMKRLGCSGRAGMTLSPPIAATQAKFLQLYHTNNRIPISRATIELVRLCQVALVLFTKLAPEYADGLLCDVTERAINDWWTDVGTEYFNVEPGDGILGPTTVAALLGMLVGARNRLNACGAPVAKDVFDLGATKRGIAYFQKSQKLPRSRRLDRLTLDRLHRVTSKAANGEGWTMPKAVKSTVVELSGKGGEMVRGMVGGRDRAGIAEVESLDIEVFIQNVAGESSKWLWHGKPRKNNNEDLFNTLVLEDEMVFSGDDNRGYIWASKKRDSVAEENLQYHSHRDYLYMQPSQSSQMSLEPTEREQALRKTVFKSVTGRMNDARSGLGRIKDAVGISGLRGHHHRFSKETDFSLEMDSLGGQYVKDRGSPHDIDFTSPLQGNTPSKAPTASSGFSEFPPESPRLDGQEASHNPEGLLLNEVSQTGESPSMLNPYAEESLSGNEDPRLKTTEKGAHDDQCHQNSSYSILSDDVTGSKFNTKRSPSLFGFVREPILPNLRSTKSISQLSGTILQTAHQFSWPRHLSFSVVDDVLISGTNEISRTGSDIVLNTQGAMTKERFLNLKATRMMDRVQELATQDVRRMKRRVGDVEELDIRAARDLKDLNALHYQRLEEYSSLREIVTDLASKQSTSLTEALKDIEVLGAKLEYELNVLQSKVEDVEDGVVELERQALELEERVQELEEDETVDDPWLCWLFKVCSGRVN